MMKKKYLNPQMIGVQMLQAYLLLKIPIQRCLQYLRSSQLKIQPRIQLVKLGKENSTPVSFVKPFGYSNTSQNSDSSSKAGSDHFKTVDENVVPGEAMI